jgi:phosphate transport system permease protein
MANYRHVDRIRWANSAFMTTLTGLCTLLAVGALLIILAHIAWQGVGSLNWQFLTDRPRPVGEGGGIGNAIVGSLVLLLISSAFGLPLGICVGIYLSEIGRGRLGGVVRFIVDTLTGIPSIVTGVFVYAIHVLPMKHF